MEFFLVSFIFFFAVIDPIGTVPVYLAVTRDYNPSEKRKIAIQATLVAAVVLVFFVIAGEYILSAMQIPLSAFQVAGGLVLFLFAISMIFGESKPEQELKLVKDTNDTAIFPLAIPSIAGPGAMLAAVMSTEKTRFTYVEQIQVTLVMISVLAIVLVLMLLASYIDRVIGKSGASVISRIMGLILASVAVNNVLLGLKLYFSL